MNNIQDLFNTFNKCLGGFGNHHTDENGVWRIEWCPKPLLVVGDLGTQPPSQLDISRMGIGNHWILGPDSSIWLCLKMIGCKNPKESVDHHDVHVFLPWTWPFYWCKSTIFSHTQQPRSYIAQTLCYTVGLAGLGRVLCPAPCANCSICLYTTIM